MGAVSSAIKSVGDAASTIGRDVGNFIHNPNEAYNQAKKTVDTTVKMIEKNPWSAVADIGAIATGNAYLIPYINAGIGIAQGQDPTKAVLNGVESGLITGGVGMAGADLAGATDSATLRDIALNPSVQQGVSGTLTSMAHGQNGSQALENGLINGVSGAAGSNVTDYTGSNLAGNLTNTLVNSGLRGTNASQSIANSLTNSGVKSAGSYGKDLYNSYSAPAPKPSTNDTTNTDTTVNSAHGGSIDLHKIVPELMEVMKRHIHTKHLANGGTSLENMGGTPNDPTSVDWKSIQELSNPTFGKTYDASTLKPSGSKSTSSQFQPVQEMPIVQMAQGPLSSLVHKSKGGMSKYHEAAPEGHHPEFITGVTGYYAGGRGTGQSDDIPAMLHDGDYVIDAEAVSALGDGSSKAGNDALMKFMHQVPHEKKIHGEPVPAKIADGEVVLPSSFVTALGHGDNKFGAKMLDAMREELREHKRSAPASKIPPKAKSPLDYLKMAKG